MPRVRPSLTRWAARILMIRAGEPRNVSCLSFLFDYTIGIELTEPSFCPRDIYVLDTGPVKDGARPTEIAKSGPVHCLRICRLHLSFCVSYRRFSQ